MKENSTMEKKKDFKYWVVLALDFTPLILMLLMAACHKIFRYY